MRLSCSLSSRALGSLKNTLLLPTTSLPIRPDNSATHIQKLLKSSTEDLYSRQSLQLRDKKPFILHDGPPYANGSLHMGHAVNKILKDIVNRVQVSSGRRVNYVPGWDCHGLPIELKALQSVSTAPASKNAASEAAERGKRMSPIEVRELARKLAAETVEEQKSVFKSWGIMGDWDNAYQTMDLNYELSQLEVFKTMVERGLIYRRFKPVYWSPSSGSALAEAELEYKDDHASKAAFIKFPLLQGLPDVEDDVAAAIWTTTPWTIPANKAIAVHPELEYSVLRFEEHGKILIASERIEYLKEILGQEAETVATGIRGENIVGMKYRHPLLDEDAEAQPLIAADFVTATSGTGLVHCAPGHGMEDYLVCLKHGIAPFSPVDNHGRFTADALPGSDLQGKEVLYAGTRDILKILEEKKVLLHLQKKFTHKYPYDWRTKLPIIVRATAQWFADVEAIKQPGVEKLEDIKFIPGAGRSRLTSFVQGRSEWCISRQRAWGVPIPALYRKDTGEALLTTDSVDHIISVLREHGTDAWFSSELGEEIWVAPQYRKNGEEYIRGKETMDVWFDSGTSWKTLGRNASEPIADLYLEGSDQHRGWFQSSLLTSIALQKKPPFKMVVTHGFCLDKNERKMSKSLGNVIVPEEIISGKIPKQGKNSAGGVDSLRLWVAFSDYTKDIVVSDSVLNYVNQVLGKMRVTARFLLGNLGDWNGQEVPYDQLSGIDKMALSQVSSVNDVVRAAYGKYQFVQAVKALATYTSSDLSAFYMDVIKDRAYSDHPTGTSRRSAQTVMFHILQNYVSLIRPVVPLLAEEITAHMPEKVAALATPEKGIAWYEPREEWNNDALKTDFQSLRQLREAVTSVIEKARASGNVRTNLECSIGIEATPEGGLKKMLDKYEDELAHLFIVSQVHLGRDEGQAWMFEDEFEVDREKVRIVVGPAKGKKCVRCWVYSAPEEGGVCRRCDDVLTQMGSNV